MQEQNISSLYKIFLLRIPFRDESYNYCLYVHLPEKKSPGKWKKTQIIQKKYQEGILLTEKHKVC